MSMQLARKMAAQAWCQPTTENKTMDVDLAEEFAIILNRATDEPRLGLATTGQLIDELRARCEVDGTINYKTVEVK